MADGKCGVCGGSFRLLVLCPKCGQRCCYADLEHHGVSLERTCVTPLDWHEGDRHGRSTSDWHEPAVQVDMQQQRTVEKFNAAHDVGTPVRYWTMARRGPPAGEGKTRTPAELLGGCAVVWVEGRPACIALSHVEPQT